MQIAKHIQIAWFCLYPGAFSHAVAALVMGMGLHSPSK